MSICLFGIFCGEVREPAAPLSRVAGIGANGTCDFVDECSTASDCRVGYNAFSCCDCGDAYPNAFLAQHPCYNGDRANCDDVCPAGGPVCDCAAPNFPVACVLGGDGGLNRCAYSPGAP